MSEPQPVLIVDLVWHRETAATAVRHIAAAADLVARERRWRTAELA
jgi:hypothetical protein